MPIVLVDRRDVTPVYAQLERGLRAAVAMGRLRAGDRLPPVRQLAVELRVNANTVARVYSELERAGILETRRGVGSFVRARPQRARAAGEHERRLRALAIWVVAETAAAGFTPDELIAELQARQAQIGKTVPGGQEPAHR
jgi:GntR family transcriptional regulator